MNKRPVDDNNLSEDWVGNNIAIQCPACGKVYIVSGLIHHGERPCPKCGKSKGVVNGGKDIGETSDNWSDVANSVELSGTEMQWLVVSANVLRPLGKAGDITAAPLSCFQSGPNLYCADKYELASVSHYHLERQNEKNAMQAALREISIWYRQAVNGIVENVRVQGSQRQIKVAGQQYHGEKPGVEIFDTAQVGSAVRLVAFGCTANEKACIADPEQSRSTATQQ
jgi:hypothetical protein